MAYTSTDAATRLEAVRAAIDKCLLAQDYMVGSRRRTMARLAELRQLERELQAEASGVRATILTKVPFTPVDT